MASILEKCLVELNAKQFQSAWELAKRIGHPASAVSSVLLRDSLHKYAHVKRRQRWNSTWEYSTYHYEEKIDPLARRQWRFRETHRKEKK